MPTVHRQVDELGLIPQRLSGTSHRDTSAHNRLLVWEMLRQRGPQSRSQLRELSGLGGSTLTYAVRDLLDHKLVRPKGKRKSDTVGKKQEFVEINPDYGHFCGVFFEGSEVYATLVDAVGRELDHRRMAYGGTMDQALDAIDAYLTDVVGASGAKGSLLGVGFAVPGIVDARARRIVQSWRLKLSDYDLGAAITRRWKKTRFIMDNEANLAAWAEAEELGEELPESMLFIALNATSSASGSAALYGMGMAVVERGQLQVGHHHCAGELDGLRQIIGELALNAQQIAHLQDQTPRLDAALAPFLQTLGRTLSILVDLIDPALVILGGSLEVRNPAFFGALRRFVAERRALRQYGDVDIRASVFGERGVAMGAAMFARRSVIRRLLSRTQRAAATN